MERGVPSGGVGEECVCCRASVWCLLAPSRGGVPLLLGETRSAELTLGDPCLLYGPFPANAYPPGLQPDPDHPARWDLGALLTPAPRPWMCVRLPTAL